MRAYSYPASNIADWSTGKGISVRDGYVWDASASNCRHNGFRLGLGKRTCHQRLNRFAIHPLAVFSIGCTRFGGGLLCGGCIGYAFPFGLNCGLLCPLGYRCETVLLGAFCRFCP